MVSLDNRQRIELTRLVEDVLQDYRNRDYQRQQARDSELGSRSSPLRNDKGISFYIGRARIADG